MALKKVAKTVQKLKEEIKQKTVDQEIDELNKKIELQNIERIAKYKIELEIFNADRGITQHVQMIFDSRGNAPRFIIIPVIVK